MGVFVGGVLGTLSAWVIGGLSLWLGLEPGRKLRPSPRLAFRLNQYWKMSIKAKPKKRGRPATGRDPMMGFRAAPVLRASIVKWAENQPDIPTLSEATRRLVELGLTVKSSVRPPAMAAARAAELATKAIDKHADMSAPSAEREARCVRMGRRPKLNAHQRREALARREAGESVTEIARLFAVAHSTIVRLKM